MSETNREFLGRILPALSAPMPYKWRVQSFSKNKPEATCVAYIDARDTMDRLDEVCSYGWHRRHAEIKGNVYCEIGISMPDGSVLCRMDCGTESNTEAEKGESSDSFKRAGVNFGIGRFLYDLEIVRLPADAKKENNYLPSVVDSNGKKVWDITKHINGLNGKKQKYSAQVVAPEEMLDNSQQPTTMPSNLTIGDSEFKVINDMLDLSSSDKIAFCSYFSISSVSALLLSDYAKAVSMLEKKINK